ncbi:hypothetical protein MIDIC_590001 [Alphaproteobacteria bacterium]
MQIIVGNPNLTQEGIGTMAGMTATSIYAPFEG